MKKEKVEFYMTVVFIIFVGICILYYLYWTVVQGHDSIQSMALLFTNLESYIAALINVLFIIFGSLTIAVFFQYILFELRNKYF